MDRSSSTFSTEDFYNLLRWLDPNEQRAAQKYETIRQRLVKIFAWRHASDPEALADNTINTVIKRVSVLANTFKGDPSLVFFAAARNVLKEHQKHTYAEWDDRESIVPAVHETANREELECLNKCMLTLTDENRELILAYYENSGQAKIERRHQLALKLGVSQNALRLRVCRIRMTLKQCVDNCLKSSQKQQE